MSLAAFIGLSALALTFDTVRLPDLETAGTGRPIEAPGGFFRLTDLNGDGLQDLVLPTYAALQRRVPEGFPEDAFVPLPPRREETVCDVWENRLFLMTAQSLRLCQLSEAGDTFAVVAEQEAPWPEMLFTADFPGPFRPAPSGRDVTFRRVLHDIDADGTPEIVLPVPEGIAVYALEEPPTGSYVPSGLLNVFPPLRMAQRPHQDLWPPEERAVAFPPRQLMCRYWMRGNVAIVLHRLEAGPSASRFVTRRYPVALHDARFTVGGAAPEEFSTPPLPNALEPCQLNEDLTIDYAGGSLALGGMGAAPAPLFDTFVTTNGGETVQVIRARSFRPHASFADVNRDGRLDLIAHHMELFENGPREAIGAIMTGRRLRHRIAIHTQGEDGQFPQRADLMARVSVELDAAPARNSAMFRLYQTAELFRLGGDVNGDGLSDLVYIGAPGQVFIHFQEDGAYAWRTGAELTVPAGWNFELLDIDGNGLDDLVFCPRPGAEETGSPAYVFLARREVNP